MFVPRVMVAGLILCFATVTVAQFPFLGECPDVPVQENFDMERFKGTWYEIQRTMSFLEFAAKCVSVNFTEEQHDEGLIEVINEGKSPILNFKKKVRLVATVPDKNETAKMLLRMNDLKIFGNYWVLSTDYDSYALIWSCNHIWLTFQYTHTENLWILSRDRTLPEEKVKALRLRLKQNKDIKGTGLLKKVNQKNCD